MNKYEKYIKNKEIEEIKIKCFHYIIKENYEELDNCLEYYELLKTLDGPIYQRKRKDNSIKNIQNNKITINKQDKLIELDGVLSCLLYKKVIELKNNPQSIDVVSLTLEEKEKIKKIDFELYKALLLSIDKNYLSIKESREIGCFTNDSLSLKGYMFAILMNGWDGKETNYVFELFNLYGYDLLKDNAPLIFYKKALTKFKDGEYEAVKKFVLEKQKSV